MKASEHAGPEAIIAASHSLAIWVIGFLARPRGGRWYYW